MNAKPLYRYADGRLPNTLAIVYTALAYGGGLAPPFAGSAWLNPLGTLLLAHGMLIAAYLIHVFAHGDMFSVPQPNERPGLVLMWFFGLCYAQFRALPKKPMPHHSA